MSYLECTLISKDGKEHHFSSAREASFFLQRTKGYVSSCTARGVALTHKYTGESYECRFDKEKREKTLRILKKPQPCCTCRKAVGGCSWSRNFTPVEGWVAIPTYINHGGNKGHTRLGESYAIIHCPEYDKG